MKRNRSMLLLLLIVLMSASWGGGKNVVKAKVPPISIDSWGGTYLGLQGGAAFTKGDVVILDPSEFTIKPNGAIAGIFIGYNWSLPENLLIGIEADIDALSVKKSVANGVENHPGIYKVKENYNGSLRLRVGKVFEDKYLPYITLGSVWTRLKVISIPSKTESKITITPGLTVGSGFEMKLTNQLNGRIEYRYNHYKKADFEHEGIGVSNIKYKSHILQVGISYRF